MTTEVVDERDDSWFDSRCMRASPRVEGLWVCLLDKDHDEPHDYSPPLPEGGYVR